MEVKNNKMLINLKNWFKFTPDILQCCHNYYTF